MNSFEHIRSGDFIQIQLKYDLRLKHSISIGPKLKAKEKDCFQAIKIAFKQKKRIVFRIQNIMRVGLPITYDFL